MDIELRIPALGESISEATLVKWLKKEGEAVAVDEAVAELETDKITVSLPAPQAGVLTQQKHPAGTVLRIGDSIGTLNTQSSAKVTAASKASVGSTAMSPPSSQATVPVVAPSHATPIAQTPSSGTQPSSDGKPKGPSLPPSQRQALREGRVLQHTTTQVAQAVSKSGPVIAAQSEEVVPMSSLRKKIAERLVEAQHTAAILTTFNEVDMTNVMALRSKYQDDFTKTHGIKLGFMSFFVKACVEAVKAFPGLNAELRGNDIVYKKSYSFGIAVGSGRGLVVPVIRNVDAMSLAQIEKAIVEMAQKAKENKLSLQDLSGGTFSITNGGIYGSMMSTPLLNLPQTGILGMHNIIRRPVAVGDRIEIRPMMYLALSYDHRVVDGREAVSCLVAIKDHIENPEKFLLGI